MALINFTVQYDLLSTLTQDVDGLGSDLAPLTGTITFVPQLPVGVPALAAAYSPRPATIMLQPRTGVIDVDGQLKNRGGGTVGVRLIANDPVLNLDRLPYKVNFNLLSAENLPIEIDSFVFDAPPNDQTINLLTVTPTTDLPADLGDLTATDYIKQLLLSPGPAAVRAALGLSYPVFIQQTSPEITDPLITGPMLWVQTDGAGNVVDVKVRTS